MSEWLAENGVAIIAWIGGIVGAAFTLGKVIEKRLAALKASDTSLEQGIARLAENHQKMEGSLNETRNEIRADIQGLKASAANQDHRLTKLERVVETVSKIETEVGTVGRDLGAARVEFASQLGELRGLVMNQALTPSPKGRSR